MYTIIMNNDKSLITSVRTTLYQREKLADKIQFLIPQKYEDIDLSECTAKLKYIDQGNVSRTELLAKDSELHKNRLRFLLPVDNKLNYFAGNINIRIIFTNEDTGQELRTGDCMITIEPSGIVEESSNEDSTSSEVYEKLSELENQIKELQGSQATDLKLTDDLLQLAVDDEVIGNGVELKNISGGGSYDEDGNPVVDFDSPSNSGTSSDEDGNTAVEF